MSEDLASANTTWNLAIRIKCKDSFPKCEFRSKMVCVVLMSPDKETINIFVAL